jgi:hypothetical protein
VSYFDWDVSLVQEDIDIIAIIDNANKGVIDP